MKNPRFPLLIASALATCFAIAPARAVELQQKWQTGQSLNYDLTMNGTTNIKVPADAPVFFAGVPLEIEVQGKGVARLNTLEVDPLGNGTIYVEVPKFDINAAAFGQKGLIELRDGTTRFLLNGKPLALGNDREKDPNKTPAKRYGLVIGKDGRIKSIVELDAAKPVVAAPKAAPRAREVADEPVAPEAAIDKGAFMTSVILRALPTLWPQKNVEVGDTWETTLPLPPTFARDAAAAANAEPLSKWTMTLKGQEAVEGKLLWRVGVVGGLQVDGKQLPKPQAPQKDAKPVPALDNLTQNVDGDLWFDADAGRVVRGEFVVDARGQSHTVDTKGHNSEPSWADFTGTFGLKLRDTLAK